MTAELFLGIDAGTSGVRACAINRMEEVAGIAMTAMPLPMQDGARVEQEADIWWDAVAETIRSLGGSRPLRPRRAAPTAPPPPLPNCCTFFATGCRRKPAMPFIRPTGSPVGSRAASASATKITL